MRKSVNKLIGVVRQEFLRLINDWRIFVCICLYVFVFFFICRQHGTGNALNSFQYTIGLSNISYLLILISAFPTTCIFCDDWLGNYIRPLVERGGIRNYIIGKILSCFISTFLIAFLGSNLFLIFDTIEKGSGVSDIPIQSVFGDLANGSIPFLYLTVHTFIYSITIAIYAVYGLALSAILPNRFVAVMAPLFMDMCMEEISYSFPSIFQLYGLETGGCFYGHGTLVTIILCAMVVCGYCIIGGLIFKWFVERRIRNEIV